MDHKSDLEARIEQWRLLKHPFYQSWEAGTLPKDALKAYAREYGAFIALMPDAWQTLNDQETVAEEIEHKAMWQDFAQTLNTEISSPEIAEVSSLLDKSSRMFADLPTAIGALFAFESQQPETASSKLEGLRAHYSLDGQAEPYFIEHSKNHHEAEKLLRLVEGLNDGDRQSALEACEEMSQALWDALTGIYNTYCIQ